MKRSCRWLLVLGLIAASTRAEERPNFILITADDVGRDWISCYGGAHATPHIDRLAQQGVRYETAWATPMCTPTRVTLLTGQYPFRHGWTREYNVPRQGGAGLSPQHFTTFARVLRKAGYQTAIGGTWQLNDLHRQSRALHEHGFHEHCVWPGAVAGKPDTENKYWDAQLMTNGDRTTVPYGPDAIHAFLVDFLKRAQQQPFLIYYPMLLARGPHVAKPLSRKQPPTQNSDLFADNVTYLDHLVGNLLRAVDEAGLQKKTMIIFTGSNGSAVAGSLHGKSQLAGKGQPRDRGVHVPFIVRAPFLTDGNRVSRDLLDFTDIFPTLLQLAGVKAPEELNLDGKSFVASLQGSDDPFEKRNWIYSQLGDVRMIRDWQHVVDSKGSFHDLQKDPLQQHTVSPLDKIAPGRRQRLQMILKRFPPNAPAPFRELADHQPNLPPRTPKRSQPRETQPGQ